MRSTPGLLSGRRVRTGLAALAVAAISACTSSTTSHFVGTDNGGTSAHAVIVCVGTPAGVRADVAALRERAALTSSPPQLVRHGGRITVTIPGEVAAGSARHLCDSSPIDLRAPVAPGVAVTCRATGACTDTTAGSLTGGAFPTPSTEAQYSSLSSAQRALIVQALAHTECPITLTSTPPAAAAQVACGPTGRDAYLFGRRIVTGSQIARASAVPPNPNGSPSHDWTVALTLTPAGSRALASWTTAHNAAGARATDADPRHCGGSTGGVPCSDFLGFLTSTQLLEVTVNEAPVVGGLVQITGGYDKQSATRLAERLGHGPLPAPLRLVSFGVSH